MNIIATTWLIPQSGIGVTRQDICIWNTEVYKENAPNTIWRMTNNHFLAREKGFLSSLKVPDEMCGT